MVVFTHVGGAAGEAPAAAGALLEQVPPFPVVGVAGAHHQEPGAGLVFDAVRLPQVSERGFGVDAAGSRAAAARGMLEPQDAAAGERRIEGDVLVVRRVLADVTRTR